MTLYVRIEHNAAGTYTASLIGWPKVVAHGETKDHAIDSLRQRLRAQPQTSKVVPLELEAQPAWLQAAGMFRDDPFAEEVAAELSELPPHPRRGGSRRELTALMHR